jgi:hypothetical protein
VLGFTPTLGQSRVATLRSKEKIEGLSKSYWGKVGKGVSCSPFKSHQVMEPFKGHQAMEPSKGHHKMEPSIGH